MPAEKTEKQIKVKLNRDHWVGETRIKAPAEIDVSFDEALRLIEAGVASRTDALKAD